MTSKRLAKSDESPRMPPATTPELRERQLIAYAQNLAEEQLRNGTASAQVITHYLKLDSSRERLEQERLQHENELTRAKIEAMSRQEELVTMFDAALKAMSNYQGHTSPELEEGTFDEGY